VFSFRIENPFTTLLPPSVMRSSVSCLFLPHTLGPGPRGSGASLCISAIRSAVQGHFLVQGPAHLPTLGPEFLPLAIASLESRKTSSPAPLELDLTTHRPQLHRVSYPDLRVIWLIAEVGWIPGPFLLLPRLILFAVSRQRILPLLSQARFTPKRIFPSQPAS